MINLKQAPFYNDPQLAVKLSNVPHKMNIWGRGTGKTTILADDMLKYVVAMPRGKFSFGGLTYFHVRTKSMPAIIDQLERRDIYRDIHYFIGHKAPKKWNWKEPYLPPLDYSNCIHFWDGSVIEFLSFDRPEMARSGSYDGMFFDEAHKLKKSAIDSDIMPANRGNKDRFGHIRFHHGTTFMGTMPITTDGEWVFEYEEMMKEDPLHYLYLEASSYDNVKVLGEQYFRDCKRTLPDIIYKTEIENKRINFNIHGFYNSLSEKHLYYNSYNYSYYDDINYDINSKGGLNSLGDSDCLAGSPLYVSFDFGSTQNCCIVAQKHTSIHKFPTIKNFYVENKELKVLVDKFIKYYEYHKCKEIYLYGGSDGTKRNDAASRKKYFDDVENWLNKAGWKVYPRYHLHEIAHMDKFLFFQKYLAGQYPQLPSFEINGNNAYETYVSMNTAPVKKQEIKKDKSSERREDQPRWKATDLSDAWDNLYYWELAPLVSDYFDDPSFDMQML